MIGRIVMAAATGLGMVASVPAQAYWVGGYYYGYGMRPVYVAPPAYYAPYAPPAVVYTPPYVPYYGRSTRTVTQVRRAPVRPRMVARRLPMPAPAGAGAGPRAEPAVASPFEGAGLGTFVPASLQALPPAVAPSAPAPSAPVPSAPVPSVAVPSATAPGAGLPGVGAPGGAGPGFQTD